MHLGFQTTPIRKCTSMLKKACTTLVKHRGIHASGACLRARRKGTARLLGQLRLLGAGAQLHRRLLAPGAARSSRRRDAALHECNALVSIDGYFNSNTCKSEPRNLRQVTGGWGGSMELMEIKR